MLWLGHGTWLYRYLLWFLVRSYKPFTTRIRSASPGLTRLDSTPCDRFGSGSFAHCTMQGGLSGNGRVQRGPIRRVFGINSARAPRHEAVCETCLFPVIDCICLRMEVVSGKEGLLVLVPYWMRCFLSSCMTFCFILMTSLFHGGRCFSRCKKGRMVSSFVFLEGESYLRPLSVQYIQLWSVSIKDLVEFVIHGCSRDLVTLHWAQNQGLSDYLIPPVCD
jgi:hypothetical protein